jgi:hypothetical protein
MATEAVRWVVALVIAAGMVLPMAGGVRAEGEKVDRWQWVEDELAVLVKELEDLDTKLVFSQTDEAKTRVYLDASRRAVEHFKQSQSKIRSEARSICATDVLVQTIQKALSCQQGEDRYLELLATSSDRLGTYRYDMALYYQWRGMLSIQQQDYLRTRADLQREVANNNLSLVRELLVLDRAGRQLELARLGLPPE